MARKAHPYFGHRNRPDMPVIRSRQSARPPAEPLLKPQHQQGVLWQEASPPGRSTDANEALPAPPNDVEGL